MSTDEIHTLRADIAFVRAEVEHLQRGFGHFQRWALLALFAAPIPWVALAWVLR